MCDKRGFPSKSSARKSITEMKDSVRIYVCDECHQYHCTRERNSKVAKNARAFNVYADRKRRHAKMKDQD
jgi:ribosome-binding protein aMBF1 (putative translation factor)